MIRFNYKDSHTDKEYIEFENFLEKEVKKILKEYTKYLGEGDNEYLHLTLINNDEDGWFMSACNNYFEAGKPRVDCVWRMER